MSLVPLRHKAAGHDGPLQSPDGLLFYKPTVQQEIEFYNGTQQRMARISDSASLGANIADWMPEYLGVLSPGVSDQLRTSNPETLDSLDPSILEYSETIGENGESKTLLVLENILNGFNRPHIMDIKLGSVLYDEEASPKKRERMKNVSLTTTSGSLSFRICGMQVPDDFQGDLPEDISNCKMEEVCHYELDGFITFDKYFGRRLDKTNVKDGLSIFFRYNKLPKGIQDIILEKFVIRLKMLYNCLLDAEVRIISGSLLFVFEGDEDRWKSEDYEDPIIKQSFISDDEEDEGEQDLEEESSTAPLSCLKFIDFAHARYTPGKGYDEELVNGVDNLLNLIENI
ncbi:DEKNAAC100552 [Brettanomyces naardenensis]|uniref:Kinase n=1 Tax=Brettanomyces naardenensis TaxID=13370 RepID=A0A448YG84_BRENA|nr:DEKNAAC100552 [Brettanomyces naardenensis]